MSDIKKAKKMLNILVILFLIITIIMVLVFNSKIKKGTVDTDNQILDKTNYISNEDNDKEVLDDNQNIEESIPTPIIIDENISINNIYTIKDNNCDLDELKGYKSILIFDKKRIGFDKYDYKDYSNQFDVESGIKEAYFCVIADVKDSLKTKEGKYFLYVFVNWGEYGGLVNVGYSLNNKVYYDYKSSLNPDLDGRIYGLETPKTYLLDLNNMIVADNKNGGYKIIKPINQLNKGGVQRIGGFVSAGENGIIDKFLLIYTGGNISPHTRK